MSSKSSQGPREAEVVELSQPLMLGSKPIAVLTFQPLKWRHMKHIPVGDPQALTMAHVIELASQLTGIPASVLEDLEGADIGKVQDVTVDFLEAALETGPSKSRPSQPSTGGRRPNSTS